MINQEKAKLVESMATVSGSTVETADHTMTVRAPTVAHASVFRDSLVAKGMWKSPDSVKGKTLRVYV